MEHNGILIDVENDPLEQHIIYAEDDTRETAAVRRKFERVLNEKYKQWLSARLQITDRFSSRCR